jgi:rare lipoprotein A (peptidoglycan hydrolase)
VTALTDDLRRSQAQLDQAANRVLGVFEQQVALSAQLAEAREILDRQAASAYEAGPAFSLELLLRSRSSSDLASVQEYAAHVLGVGGETVERVQSLTHTLDGVRAELQARQDALAAATDRLRSVAAQAQQQLDAAKQLAKATGSQVKELEKAARDLARAQADSASSLSGLVDSERGVDQSKLLALLGPNGGRGCDIPSGLRDTGIRMAGISSWYGWGFAGNHTASGAIYDPRLFTAANKELPLNTFIRVHFGSKCAIVLVNDRGPYVDGREFDLSQAAAEYLGVSLNYVTADVLAVR